MSVAAELAASQTAGLAVSKWADDMKTMSPVIAVAAVEALRMLTNAVVLPLVPEAARDEAVRIGTDLGEDLVSGMRK